MVGLVYGLTITNGTNGEATLTGPLTDQASLHGVLIKIRDLGLPLIAIMPADATADGLTGTQCGERAPHEGDDGRLGQAHQRP